MDTGRYTIGEKTPIGHMGFAVKRYLLLNSWWFGNFGRTLGRLERSQGETPTVGDDLLGNNCIEGKRKKEGN